MDDARSTYWFTPPFDMAFDAAVATNPQVGSPQMFDMQEFAQGVYSLVIPESTYAAIPRASPIKETVQLQGTLSRCVHVNGTLDQVE